MASDTEDEDTEAVALHFGDENDEDGDDEAEVSTTHGQEIVRYKIDLKAWAVTTSNFPNTINSRYINTFFSI